MQVVRTSDSIVIKSYSLTKILRNHHFLEFGTLVTIDDDKTSFSKTDVYHAKNFLKFWVDCRWSELLIGSSENVRAQRKVEGIINGVGGAHDFFVL